MGLASRKLKFASSKLKTRDQGQFSTLFHVVVSDFRQNRFKPVLGAEIGLALCPDFDPAENL